LLCTIHGHDYLVAFSHSIYSEGGFFSRDKLPPTIVSNFIGCVYLAFSLGFMYHESEYCHTEARR